MATIYAEHGASTLVLIFVFDKVVIFLKLGLGGRTVDDIGLVQHRHGPFAPGGNKGAAAGAPEARAVVVGDAR